MFEKLLLCTDFSEYATKILRVCPGLAWNSGNCSIARV